MRFKRYAWTVAYVIMFVANIIILSKYNSLNSDFKASLTESCQNRQASREAYRHIIFTLVEGHPDKAEIIDYVEIHLPPVVCE